MHEQVQHPRELMDSKTGPLSKLNEWATRNLALALGSAFGMWLSFLVPLVALEVPKLLALVGLFSSYWIQLWALFVLQRSANLADKKASAKADADHIALTHIATKVDALERKLNG